MIKTYLHIAKFLEQLQGIDITMYDDSFIETTLRKRMLESQCTSTIAYENLLEKDQNESGIFINSLHIGYSEFFRNPLTFAVLERIALPSLIQQIKMAKRNELRIWSAACATGQEPYSLAMLLEEHKTSMSEKINYRIIATDKCQTKITEAQEGRYSASAINNLSLKRINQWFTKQDDSYYVKPELKKHINFTVFDLFNKQFSAPPESIFGDFDLIVCANLLFYYKPKYRNMILEKTGNSLVNGGYLIVGETERQILLSYNYQEVFPQSGIFRKI